MVKPGVQSTGMQPQDMLVSQPPPAMPPMQQQPPMPMYPVDHNTINTQMPPPQPMTMGQPMPGQMPPQQMPMQQMQGNLRMPGPSPLVNIVAQPAEPKMVCDGVYWNALGPGQVCEVDNCGNAAYQICNYDHNCCRSYYKGCGKKMCMAHCHIVFKESSHGKQLVHYYNCKDTECHAKTEEARKKMCMSVFIPMYCCFFVLILSSVILG